MRVLSSSVSLRVRDVDLIPPWRPLLCTSGPLNCSFFGCAPFMSPCASKNVVVGESLGHMAILSAHTRNG